MPTCFPKREITPGSRYPLWPRGEGGGEEEVRAADSPTLHKYQFHYSRDVITNHV